MDTDRLLVGIAAVFAGTTVLLAILAFVYQPFLLFLAAPFGAASGLVWYHASGRLAARIRQSAASAAGRRRRRGAAGRGPSDFEGFGPGRRAARGGDRRTADRSGGRRGRRAQSDGDGAGRRAGPARGPSEPTRAEAYRTLGLDPGADDDAVRAAYRERVKAVHPDTDAGDEEQFKRVNRAYERLTE
ncbi:MAG: J domain-containing protein [Haloquadratum sp.]